MNDKELRWFIDSLRRGGLATLDPGTVETALLSALEECQTWRSGATAHAEPPAVPGWHITTVGELRQGDVIVGASPSGVGKAARVVGMSKVISTMLCEVVSDPGTYVMIPLERPDVPTWRQDAPASQAAFETATLELVR